VDRFSRRPSPAKPKLAEISPPAEELVAPFVKRQASIAAGIGSVCCFDHRNCNVNVDELHRDRPELIRSPSKRGASLATFNWTRQVVVLSG
jgi:hypothetical protein